jgi:hypothetical protein
MLPLAGFADVTPTVPERPPLLESLLTESATDVDATEAGEIEYEANLASVGARRGGAHAWLSSLEIEGGDAAAHAPLHTDLAILTPFAGEGEFGFVGLEVRADWARAAPLVVAPDVAASRRRWVCRSASTWRCR